MFHRFPFYSAQNARYIATTMTALAKSHYDSLGISPKATQTDVKSAYYNLSKVYHPDVNQGSQDAANKFRDITAAYEVLGNVRLRKLYDKGVNIGEETVYRQPMDEDDPKARFYRSRERRTRPPSTGRTPIYDFDEWARSHYGATFARDMARKRREEYIRKMEVVDEKDFRVERVIVTLIIFYGILMFFMRDVHDIDRVYNTKRTPPKATQDADV